MKKNSKDVLTSDSVIYMAVSSGTTGRNKTLPLTSFTKRTAALDIAPMMHYATAKKVGICLKRVLVLSFRAETSLCQSGIRKGPVSSHIGKYFPYIVGPREIYSIQNEQYVLHMLAIVGLSDPEIVYVEALFSTFVYSFWRYIESNWNQICEIIETGTLSFPRQTTSTRNTYLPQQLLEKLQSYFKPNPGRAKLLREEFGLGFESIAKRVWPELRSVRMITSGSFAHHAKLLADVYMKKIEQLSLLHAASEGFFGVAPYFDNKNYEGRYTLLPEYGFFEFIHDSRIYMDQPETIFAENVSSSAIHHHHHHLLF